MTNRGKCSRLRYDRSRTCPRITYRFATYVRERPDQIAEDDSAAYAQAEAGLRHVRAAKHYKVKLRDCCTSCWLTRS